MRIVPPLLRQVASANLPTHLGDFRILGFELYSRSGRKLRHETGVALIMGDFGHKSPLLRIQSQCLTGEAFSSLRCDCGERLQASLSMIAQEGAGLLIYEEQEGRGIGLIPKVQVYELQDQGYDTVEANLQLGFKPDFRDFLLPVQILNRLGIGRVRLITDNPKKVRALTNAGIAVIQRIPCEAVPAAQALRHLKNQKGKDRPLADQRIVRHAPER
jgi:GTP cyclohydrolase II